MTKNYRSSSPSGQFRRRRVRFPDPSSCPCPLLARLSPHQLPLHPGRGAPLRTRHPRRHAPPPRLGDGQDGHGPAILSQVRSKFKKCSSLSIMWQHKTAGGRERLSHTHTHTLTHTHVHTHIHACIHTYIHTYMQARSEAFYWLTCVMFCPVMRHQRREVT